MYINRDISDKIIELSQKMPIITISGPRQSGKTTLVKHLFPDYKYYNMEMPMLRERFLSDPLSFLNSDEKGFIIDEFQRVPEILSYIQVISDENNLPGRFILTGSQNYLMIEKISQSLAGRTSLINLLPFSIEELKGTEYFDNNADKLILKGFYPRIYNQELNSNEWLNDYISLYIERDIKQLINIKDSEAFSLFIRLCAGRIGQILNYSSIGEIVGRDIKTIKSWINVLETGYIIFKLKPYYSNINKRLIKSPKLYFYDVGLASAILGIKDVNSLESHYLRGNLFENFVIAELLKNNFNKNKKNDFYFWNEQSKNEIDLLIERSNQFDLIEIKASKTFNQSFTKNILNVRKSLTDKICNSYIIYNNEEKFSNNEINVISWKEMSEII